MRHREPRAGGLACGESQGAQTQGEGGRGQERGAETSPEASQERWGEGPQGPQAEEEEKILSSGINSTESEQLHKILRNLSKS